MSLTKYLLSFPLLSRAFALQHEDKPGRLPALGWNSWNAFDTEIDENKILTAAHMLVSLGLKVPSRWWHL